MREADFQRWVIDVATRTGWLHWHVPAPMRAVGVGGNVGFVGAREGAGIADLILVHDDPARLVFAELKGTDRRGRRGRVTEAQLKFLAAVNQVGDTMFYAGEPVMVRGYLWAPGMEEQIETVLRSRELT